MLTALLFTVMPILLCVQKAHAEDFTYRWVMDKTPEGVEHANMNQPVKVLLMNAVIETAPH